MRQHWYDDSRCLGTSEKHFPEEASHYPLVSLLIHPTPLILHNQVNEWETVVNHNYNTSCGLIRYGLFTAESSDFVESNFYNTYNTTQFSILDSHCPELKQEVGKRNSSLFLLPFLLPVMRFAKFYMTALEISPLPLNEVPSAREGKGL